MRIVIARSGELDGSGVTRVMQSWAGILRRANHDVMLLSQELQGERSFPAIDGVAYEDFPAPADGGRLATLFRGRQAAVNALDALIDRCGVDLVINHDSLLTVGFRRVRPDFPVLHTFHSPFVDENRLGNWKYGSPARRLTYPATLAMAWSGDRAAIRAATHAHTLSEYTWNRLSGLYPGPCSTTPWTRIPGTYDDRIFVPPADRAAVRRELGLDPQALVLFTVRRLVPRNGVDRILLAAQSPGKRGNADVVFLIGGTGPLADSLRRSAEDAGLGDRVRFLGFVPDDRLAAYYQAADAFLLPTRELECFGLPVIEAMGCGATPLVMPDGGPAEVCRPFPDCVAAENTDQAFVDLVERFVCERFDRALPGLADHAREQYSEAAVHKRVADLVRHVVERPARPSE